MSRFAVLVMATAIAIGVACSGDGDEPPGSTPATASPARAAASPTQAASPTPALASPTPQACDFETATQLIFGSVVQVVTDDGAGTGYYIGASRFITAAHVVEGVSEVQLFAPGYNATATVVGIEVETDVAVLSVEDAPGFAAIEWGDASALSPGQLAGVAGYPVYVYDTPSVTSGRISKVFEDPDLGFGTFIQTDAPVNPGNSGGPVFDECGRVVGMVVLKPANAAIEGIGWAIAENTVQSAIPRAVRKGPPAIAPPRSVVLSPELSRFIGNTGGAGVSLRSDCSTGARIGGSWVEATEVRVTAKGQGECEGWSLASVGATESWVGDGFLTETRPVVPTPTSVPVVPTPTSVPVVPTPTSVPVAVSLAGTMWDMYADWRVGGPLEECCYPMTALFLGSGELVLLERDGTDGGTSMKSYWLQDGFTVWHFPENVFSTSTGLLSADGTFMSGSGENDRGVTWDWYAVRR